MNVLDIQVYESSVQSERYIYDPEEKMFHQE